MFSKNNKIINDLEDKYSDLLKRYDELYEENRALKKQVNILETRIKKT